jgi:hypothetical protein
MNNAENLIKQLKIEILNLEGYAHSQFLAGMEEVLRILESQK